MKVSKLVAIATASAAVWIAVPFFIFTTQYFFLIVMLCMGWMFFYLILGIVLAMRGRRQTALGLALSVMVASCVITSLGKTKIYVRQGFLIHIAIEGKYFSKCKTQMFSIFGSVQHLGVCEIAHWWPFDDIYYIIYDTSGEIALSPPNRDSEWHRAAELLENGRMLANAKLSAQGLFGHYYYVSLTIKDIAQYL